MKIGTHSSANYLSYLQEKDENSIVKQSLQISIDLHYNSQNSFYSSLMKMTDYYDFYDFNRYSLNDCKIKHYMDLMKKKNISYWRQILQHSQSLASITQSNSIIALLPT